MENLFVNTQDLSKKYTSRKQVYAIQDLNLEIPKGCIFGLIGPDGAGKSTTLRILATVIESTSGKANISGFDVKSQAEDIRVIVGYMPQNFSLYLDLSVMENLVFFANIHRIPMNERSERITRMLTFTQLNSFIHRRARDLSGGMKKKLALACALIHNPQVLILDEPTTGVDPVSRREFWGILTEVVQDGVTVIVSTPYMDEAERCHLAAVLFQGQVIAYGSPAQLKQSLPFDIIELKAKPRKSTRLLVSQMPGLLDWRPVGDCFRLAVKKSDLNNVLEKLRKKLETVNLDIHVLRHVPPSMEDAFIYQAHISSVKMKKNE